MNLGKCFERNESGVKTEGGEIVKRGIKIFKLFKMKGCIEMFAIVGWSLISGSILWSVSPLFQAIFMKEYLAKKKLIKNLTKAFVNGKLKYERGRLEVYPSLLNFDNDDTKQTFVFSVPKGLNPEEFAKKYFVFQQHFGKYIDLDIDVSRGILKVYAEGLPKEITYNYDQLIQSAKGLKLPIVCGQSLEGNIFSFDLVKFPHILIAGETGSGKSSEIRSIITTLIKAKKSNELKLVLGDLKRSEFHLFKNIDHVEGVYHSAEELKPALKKVKKEMKKRGNKLDEAGVNSVDELKEKLPYIIVCIDEVVLLKNETDIMDIIEEISSIGRSLGVFIILSMQRPDAKLLDGKLKVNLTVRMGFKTADSINSKIIGTVGSEKIEVEGRMLLKVNSHVQEIQCPWLNNKKAKKLLQPYIVEPKADNMSQLNQDKYSKVAELLNNEKT